MAVAAAFEVNRRHCGKETLAGLVAVLPTKCGKWASQSGVQIWLLQHVHFQQGELVLILRCLRGALADSLVRETRAHPSKLEQRMLAEHQGGHRHRMHTVGRTVEEMAGAAMERLGLPMASSGHWGKPLLRLRTQETSLRDVLQASQLGGLDCL